MIRISNDARYPSSCSCVYYGLIQTEEKLHPVFEKPHTENMSSLLSIIKTKMNVRYKVYGCECDALRRSLSLSDIRPIPNYKKWKSKINSKFKIIIEKSLTSFASKLDKINCGSFEEKKYFLSEISGEVATNYPFKAINDLMISFVDEKIAKVVRNHTKKEIEEMSSNHHRHYNKLEEVILKKAKETILKEDNRMELIDLIVIKINELHKKELLHLYRGRLPFNIFSGLYRCHLEESYDLIVSKSIEILDNIAQDDECCMSFLFDTFFGKMIIYNKADQLYSLIRDNICNTTINDLRCFMAHSISSRGLCFGTGNVRGYLIYSSDSKYRDDFEKFVMRSKKSLEKKIIECLKNNTIVIEENKVTICNKKFTGEIVRSSVNLLEEEIRSAVL
ncbi:MULTISPECIES: hypothetical protein [Candidatus Ichthyocystis]|uniref:Uncharacterized protein n=1 Tax=Candidatus Ichthyocystis hellenicum TaxID=1561003 RepID=A0A0S4M3P2_9BURK|nr:MULTISPECIES: hypothetical protein [Ichthyocystis]CUT18302.1 hypothetical protein Ark11_1504 [Candidatus Ichthyocystis hellenicum]